MNMLEEFINAVSAWKELALKDNCNRYAEKYASAESLARSFLEAKNTVQCKNRNCRKPVVNDKPLGRKKEYCDNKCRMTERSNRVKNKETK